jgi:ATP-dependent Clp protease ATP-binding subunit ClpB
MKIEQYTERARGFIHVAQSLALRDGHQLFSPLHLLKVLLDDSEGLAGGLIDRAGGSSRAILKATEDALNKLPKVSGSGAGQIYLSPELAHAFDAAEKAADKAGDSFVTVERLLLGLTMVKGSEATTILAKGGLTRENLNATIEAMRKGRTADAPRPTFDALSKYGYDLTRAAGAGKFGPVVRRDEEIRRTIQVLSQRSKNSPMLIGEPGVGKSAIVTGLAQRIVYGDVPESLKDRILLMLDLGALKAGAKSRGEMEERLKAVVQEAVAAEGGVIFCIDDMHSLFAGGVTDDTSPVSNLLRPALERSELQLIVTTTPQGYRYCLQRDAAFARLVHPISVPEPSLEDAISILRAVRPAFEQHHGLRITDGALVAAVTLSQEHIASRFLPDKAIDLIDQAAARLRIRLESKPEELDSIDREIVRLKIEQETLRDDPGSKNRLQTLKKELVGLEERSAAQTARWSAEKNNLSSAAKLKSELDALRVELANAQRRGDFQHAGELAYGRIPGLEKQLTEVEASATMEESVTADDVSMALSQQPDALVQSGKIFISYRRRDSAGYAGRVHDRLEREFGRDLVFMDVDSIPLGADFVEILRAAVSRCDVLLALIGQNWVDAQNESGLRRLDDPLDFVRIEIATALEHNIPIIPILFDGAAVPRDDQLPIDLQGLSLRNGLEVRHASFHGDVEKLIRALQSRRAVPKPERNNG